jgi:hypothetical protein
MNIQKSERIFVYSYIILIFMVMNLPDIKHITLICTQPMVAHWGDILIPGI